MGLNQTASAERTHIAFFGMRNAGKSSLVNAVTGQELAVVSNVKGTTTDPVKKAMEILPLGPVVIIDTPGFDDEGMLGDLRVKKTKEILRKTDIAVLAVDAVIGKSEKDEELISLFTKNSIPYLIVYTKYDALKNEPVLKDNEICVSSKTGYNINALKEKLASLGGEKDERRILKDLVTRKDIVVLVTPIDAAAPKGRMILPQQQTIREVLDCECICVTCREFELEETLKCLKKAPSLVVTDSQAFETVDKTVPKEIPLTSFSILFARYKGELSQLVKGARKIEKLKDGDKILICEGCTHHRQCGDIGTDKMPRWLRNYTKKDFEFSFTSGVEFPDAEELSKYALVIHCGGCMLNRREMLSRLRMVQESGTDIVNYGVAIAYMHGILDRSISMFNI